MAKPKSESNGVVVQDGPQLMLAIDLDDIESIPTESAPIAIEAPIESALVPDSEESILATVETFDAVFGSDPLKAKYLAFGQKAKSRLDTAEDAKFYVSLGSDLYELMSQEINLAPASYERKKVTAKAETALRLCDVPESMVRPNEILGMFWLVHLDRSNPGASEGEPRSFASGPIPDDYFTGNLSYGMLRELASTIKNAAGKGEMDLYEYKDGWESKVRDWIARARNRTLVIGQVRRLKDAHKKFLEDSAKHAERAGLTDAEIAALDAAVATQSREKRLSEIKSDALTFQKNAAEKLKMGKEDLRDLLANMQIIPPVRMTPQEYAAQMTPGDAKALVQELIKLYPTKPDRIQVFKVLLHTCRSIADQIKSAREKEPLKKTG